MAKVHKITKKYDTKNYEVNSYWYRNDVSTGTYFNILCDYRIEQLIRIIQEPMLDNNNFELRKISRPPQ